MGFFHETPPFSWMASVRWDDSDDYSVIRFFIYRRMMSEGTYLTITANQDAVDAYFAAHPEGDHIRQTLITYSFNYPWPTPPSVFTFSSPPFDVSPGSIADGMPDLPALPGPAVGAGCTTLAGHPWGDPSQGGSYFPGIRAVGSPGGTPPSYPNVPAPPTFFGVTNGWGSPDVDIEIYIPNEEAAGAAVDSFTLSLGGVFVTRSDVIYAAIAAAPVPREEGQVQHNPPFTGPATAINTNNSHEIWVLCQRTTPP